MRYSKLLTNKKSNALQFVQAYPCFRSEQVSSKAMIGFYLITNRFNNKVYVSNTKPTS